MTFGMTRIDAKSKEALSNNIILDELSEALSTMKPNKAPGCDGLTMEFYAKFWPLLGPCVLNWATQVIEKGYMSGTAAVGVITLIHKKGDPRDISNWRPITLLTIDAKIILKVMANRLKTVIDQVIPPIQHGIPGRTIYNALHVIRDSITMAKKSKTPIYILALDQQKAFDRVSHTFLFHLLHKIGLPEYLINAIKSFYTGFRCQVKNVTYLTSTFPYRRGVRQGDPLATMLYVIALQPVLNALNIALGDNSEKSIQKLPLVVAYADDVTIFLKHPDAVEVVITIFKQLSKYSEAVLNLDKSTITFFGQECCNSIKHKEFHNIPFTANHTKILGVEFGDDGKILKSQWESKLQSIKEKIANNTNILKNMSYYDRAQWVNIRLWPRFAYLCKVLQPTSAQVGQLNTLFADTIWLGAKHWLPIKTLTLPVKNGGINLVSIVDKIYMFRIQFLSKCLTKGKSHTFSKLAEQILGLYNSADLGFRILHTVFDESRKTDLPFFYQAALKAWNQLPTSFFPSSAQTVMSLPSFNSKPLQDMIPSHGLTTTQAFTHKTFTINEVLQYETKSCTRSMVTLKISMLTAVDGFAGASAPVCPCMADEGGESVIDDVNWPTFYLPYNQNLLHSCAWPNNVIYSLLRETDALSNSSLMWSAIRDSAAAPAVYKNRYWRLMHGVTASSSFLCKIKDVNDPKCTLCGTQDITQIHQFRTCSKVQLALDLLQEDLDRLSLQVDDLPFSLVTEKGIEMQLANLLIMAYAYSIMEMVKIGYDTGDGVNQFMVRNNYILVLSKHVIIQDNIFPNKVDKQNLIWTVLSTRNILTSLGNGNEKLVRVPTGYVTIEEANGLIKDI